MTHCHGLVEHFDGFYSDRPDNVDQVIFLYNPVCGVGLNKYERFGADKWLPVPTLSVPLIALQLGNKNGFIVEELNKYNTIDVFDAEVSFEAGYCHLWSENSQLFYSKVGTRDRCCDLEFILFRVEGHQMNHEILSNRHENELICRQM